MGEGGEVVGVEELTTDGWRGERGQHCQKGRRRSCRCRGAGHQRLERRIDMKWGRLLEREADDEGEKRKKQRPRLVEEGLDGEEK